MNKILGQIFKMRHDPWINAKLKFKISPLSIMVSSTTFEIVSFADTQGRFKVNLPVPLTEATKCVCVLPNNFEFIFEIACLSTEIKLLIYHEIIH